MAENKTDIKEKFKRMFNSPEKQDEEKIINILDIQTNENDFEDLSQVNSEVEQSDEITTEDTVDDTEQTSGTEREREIVPENMEEKIKSIRENAINTYAKETDDEPSLEQENTEAMINESNAATEEGNPKTVACESNANESSSSDLGKTKDYNMNELLRLLKNEEGDANIFDEEDDEPENKKKKKKARNDFTEEQELDINDSELYDDVNEYYHDFEYTERVQGTELFKSFRKSAVFASLAAILTFVVTALCIWFEVGHAAGLPFSNVMNAGRYGRIFAMVSLEMLALCIFFNLDGLARGIRKMSLKQPAPEALSVATTVICVLHTVYTAIFAYESTSYRTFCFAGCFMLFVLSVNTFIKAYTRFKAFAMVLSKKPKITTSNLDANSKEYEAFSKYLSEDSDILSVEKADMVSEFVKRTYTVPSATFAFNAVMYVILAVSVVIGFISAFLLEASAYQAITNAVSVFLLSCPVSSLAVTAIPYFVTSTKVNKIHAAILGEAACDFYENSGVISFDDTEVFPPKAVKVTSIKTYNDNRIDKVIVYMAKIFEKVGGPLSYVFSSTIQTSADDTSEIMIVENSSDGLHLKIDNEDILVGTGKYLRMYDIEAPVDNVDETELRSLTSILYLVSNNQLAAKFYIKYSLNKRFENILKSFYDAGICCGVKTADPGIDNQLIAGNLKGTNYPISVINKSVMDISKKEESLAGSLICVSGIHSFLRSFIMLDKMRGTYKTNSVFGILGAIIGLAVSIGLIFTGGYVSSIVLLLFQIFWLLPAIFISLFSN